MTRPTDEAPLPERLARAITLGGPIPVSQFMAAANAHYYATRDPLGAGYHMLRVVLRYAL